MEWYLRLEKVAEWFIRKIGCAIGSLFRPVIGSLLRPVIRILKTVIAALEYICGDESEMVAVHLPVASRTVSVQAPVTYTSVISNPKYTELHPRFKVLPLSEFGAWEELEFELF